MNREQETGSLTVVPITSHRAWTSVLSSPLKGCWTEWLAAKEHIIESNLPSREMISISSTRSKVWHWQWRLTRMSYNPCYDMTVWGKKNPTEAILHQSHKDTRIVLDKMSLQDSSKQLRTKRQGKTEKLLQTKGKFKRHRA